jgi:C4-dicarboxylate-binding protein DctP
VRKIKALSVAAAVALLAGQVQAQDPVTLKFSHEATESQIKGRSAILLAEKVAEYSNGTLQIEVFPGASLIATKDEVRAAIRGQVDIIAPQTSYFVPFNPAWDVFYQPLLFNSAKEGMDTLAGELGGELLADLERVGLTGLGVWHDGPGYLYTTDTPVVTPEDLEGRQIRVFPSAPLEAAVREAGAVPVSLPGPDVFLALQQNLVGGVISAVTFAAPQRWYEVLKTATRMTMFVGGYGVVINTETWDGLSPEHQEVLTRAMEEVSAWNYANSEQNILDSEKLLSDNGVELIDLTDEQLAQWREALTPVYEQQPEEVRALIQRIQDTRN